MPAIKHIQTMLGRVVRIANQPSTITDERPIKAISARQRRFELLPTPGCITRLDEPPARRFVTERELIRLLSIPRTSLWRLRKSGMPAIKFGRSIRYDVEKVRL